MTRVLVTGAGSLAGYGVIRSLRHWRPEFTIIGGDTDPNAVGFQWSDERAGLAPGAAPDYLDSVARAIERHRVDVVVPTHPAEIGPLARWDDPPVPIAVDRAELVELRLDKWLWYQQLRAVGEPSLIPTQLLADADEGGFETHVRVVAKPRRCSGSRGLAVFEAAELQRRRQSPGAEVLIVQPYVGSDAEEYSAAVFGDGGGGFPARIVLHRELDPGGWTKRARLAQPTSLDPVLDRLAATLRPRGAINLQFRREGESWWLLDINPRISSSTSIRSMLGYPEAAMAVDLALHGQLPTQPALRSASVTRFLDEVETS